MFFCKYSWGGGLELSGAPRGMTGGVVVVFFGGEGGSSFLFNWCFFVNTLGGGVGA